jgi:colanic acid biosynthesis protein WcaH
VDDIRNNTGNGWLDATSFKTVVAATPLISIDLLVENEQGEYLLGLRNNRPAQGYWFVPGGRVLKNETLDAAFRRLTREELGNGLERSQAGFKGLYEHFYDDSVFGDRPGTHYIVLAHQLKVSQAKGRPSEQQHCQSQWIAPEAIRTLNTHRYTRDYFEPRHAR